MDVRDLLSEDLFYNPTIDFSLNVVLTHDDEVRFGLSYIFCFDPIKKSWSCKLDGITPSIKDDYLLIKNEIEEKMWNESKEKREELESFFLSLLSLCNLSVNEFQDLKTNIRTIEPSKYILYSRKVISFRYNRYFVKLLLKENNLFYCLTASFGKMHIEFSREFILKYFSNIIEIHEYISKKSKYRVKLLF